jgi:hypothetical protein
LSQISKTTSFHSSEKPKILIVEFTEIYHTTIGSALQHVRLPNLSLNHESEIKEIKKFIRIGASNFIEDMSGVFRYSNVRTKILP